MKSLLVKIDLLTKIMSIDELFTHFSNLTKDSIARVIPSSLQEIEDEIQSCRRYCQHRLVTSECPDDRDHFIQQLAEIDDLLAFSTSGGWSHL